MTDHFTRPSQRECALTAGWALLVMTACALFSDWFVFQRLVVAGDAGTTASRIAASVPLFRWGILSLVVILICDVVVAWALYLFFEPVDRGVSLLAAWLRLMYAAMLGIALPSLLGVVSLIRDADYLATLDAGQRQVQVLLSVERFHDTWALGLIVFGLHVTILGVLTYNSRFVPKVFAFLLIVAGLSYPAEYVTKLLLPDFDVPLSSFVGWGELVFAFWLLLQGGKVRQRADAHAAS